MSATPKSLDPAILDRLSQLSLVARTVVEGFQAGQHRSPHRGSSVEFQQHRQYVPGDELKRLDWKVFARSDRLVVKEFVEETNLALHLLVDASESMAYGSGSWSKFDYARWAAAALAHLVLGKRDTAGLVVFDDGLRAKVPPGNGAPQEAAILRSLEEALVNFPGCAVVISHDRWFLDRIATHIMAFEGDGNVHWCEGNFQTYEAERRERLGAAADEPKRYRYKKLVR